MPSESGRRNVDMCDQYSLVVCSMLVLRVRVSLEQCRAVLATVATSEQSLANSSSMSSQTAIRVGVARGSGRVSTLGGPLRTGRERTECVSFSERSGAGRLTRGPCERERVVMCELCVQAIGAKLAKADISDATEQALVTHRFGCVRLRLPPFVSSASTSTYASAYAAAGRQLHSSDIALPHVLLAPPPPRTRATAVPREASSSPARVPCECSRAASR